MTILQIIETIQETFPDVSLRECLRKMSTAQREFAAVTKCLVGPYLVEVSQFVNGTWPMDENLLLVRGAVFIDADGAVVNSDFVFNVSQHVVTLYNTDGSIMTTTPSRAVSVRFWGVLLPDDIAETEDAMSEAPVINQRFHMALVYGAFAELGPLKGRSDVGEIARNSLKKLIVEGKRYANIEGNDVYDVQGRLHYTDTADGGMYDAAAD